MTFPFAKRTLLVAALLVGQLVCLLLGVFWFGQWIERGLSEIVRERVLSASRQIAVQFGRTVDLLEIEELPLSRKDWNRLQTLVEDVRLPNGGQLAIIDSDTGEVLAHPDLRENPEAAQLPFAEALLSEPVDPAADEGWKRMPNGDYLLAASDLPELNAFMLAIQPEEPLYELTATFAGRVRVIGLIVVVVLLAFSGVLSYIIMHTYEDRMAAVNRGLEDLVARRSRALMHSREGAIFGLAKLAEARDGETGEHLERISTYTELLARQIAGRDPDLNENWVHSLAVASSLHDIGKVGIPDAVLLKPGALTDEERETVQKHPYIGGETLLEIQRRWGDDPFLVMASEICFGHHERWDGKGYPFGLAGVHIPLAARIVALADVYDALTSRRAYKEPLSHEEARQMIVEQSGTHFDPGVVQAFLAVEDQFQDVTAGTAEATGAAPSPDERLADATPAKSVQGTPATAG